MWLAERKGFSFLIVSPLAPQVRIPSGVRRGVAGGEEGIRTPVTVSGKPDFESGAFSHSATSP